MDPNAALTQLRDAVTRALRVLDREGELTEAEIVLEALADAAGALDEWLTRGGFLPHAWDRDRPMNPGNERAEGEGQD